MRDAQKGGRDIMAKQYKAPLGSLTANQKKEIEIIKYFIPTNIQHQPITDKDIKAFYDWSDRGIGEEAIKQQATGLRVGTYTGLAALYWGKNRRDLQITSYKEDYGNYITSYDFVEEPRLIAQFIAQRLKKPGIMDVWKLHHNEKLNADEIARLEPFAKLAGV